MRFEATDKNRFDTYFAEDIADALNVAAADVQKFADAIAVLTHLAQHWHLEITPALVENNALLNGEEQ